VVANISFDLAQHGGMTHGPDSAPFGQLPGFTVNADRHADEIEEMFAENTRFALVAYDVSALQAVEITRQQLHRHAGIVELEAGEMPDMRRHLHDVGARDLQRP